MKLKRIPITIIVLAIIFVIGFYKDGPNTDSEEIVITAQLDTANVTAKPDLKFGIPIDSFTIETKKVGRNQNLSSILFPYGVSALEIDKIVKKAEGIFDLRNIRFGKDYHLFWSKEDTARILSHFVYQHDPIEYLSIDFSDSVNVSAGKEKIKTIKKTAFGTIKSSLWKTMVENNLNPVLANELSEIFAWTIDFFGLQEGDAFKIIYDEKFVDSLSVGIGQVHAACMDHMGEKFYAIPFVQDSIRDFYDEEGQSLRKAFLKAPLRFSRISSRYSLNRLHPVLKIRRPHRGVDYAAPTGTPVYAIGDGYVVKKGWDSKGGGNYLKIKHNGIYTTGYLHLRAFAKDITEGTFVKQGQIIGYVGQTGLATGPHLDFRFYKNGHPIDPLKVEAPPVEPVHEENLSTFHRVKEKYIKELDNLNSV